MSDPARPFGFGPSIVRRLAAGGQLVRHLGSGPVVRAVESWDPEASDGGELIVVRRLHGQVDRRSGALRTELLAVASNAWPMRRGQPPPDVDAVVFSDPAELLVALARAVAAGGPAQWWVGAVLGRGSTAVPLACSESFRRAWSRWPEAMPVACARDEVAMTAATATLDRVVVLELFASSALAHHAGPLHAAVRACLERGSGAGRELDAAPPGPVVRPTVPHLARPTGIRDPAVRPTSLGALCVASAALLARSRALAVNEDHAAWFAACASDLLADPGTSRGDAASDGPDRPLDAGANGGRRDASATTESRPRDRNEGPAPPSPSADEAGAPSMADVDRLVVTTRLGGSLYLTSIIDRLLLAGNGRAASGDPWDVLGTVTGLIAADQGMLTLVDDGWPAVLDVLASTSGSERLGAIDPDGIAAAWWLEQIEAELAAFDLERSLVFVDAVIEIDDLFVRGTFPLDSVDIRLRRTGLDRSPGWMPRWGRAVTWEFR